MTKKNTKHSDDKKLNQAGKQSKGQNKSQAKGGKAADKGAENALRKLLKGL